MWASPTAFRCGHRPQQASSCVTLAIAGGALSPEQLAEDDSLEDVLGHLGHAGPTSAGNDNGGFVTARRFEAWWAQLCAASKQRNGARW